MEAELYKKYRPDNFDQVVGQDEAVAQLKTMARDKRFPHTILFTGPSGTGKTTIARILRTKLKCSDMDFFERNASEDRGIESIRAIQRTMPTRPMAGKAKVYLIDECHAMTADAQNAFLKILEDTPSHVYFFLATTDPQKLKKTIITRCHEVKCKAIPESKLKQLVKEIAAKENVELDQEVADALVEVCDGSARKALVILNGIIGIKSKEEQLRGIAEGVDVRKQAFDLVQALMYNKKWPAISKILTAIQHEEPEGVRRLVLSYCSKVVLGGGNQAQRAADIIEVFEYNFYDSGFAGLIMSCRKVTNN